MPPLRRQVPHFMHRPPPPLPPLLAPQMWNLVRQRDVTRQAAVKLCQSLGERVSPDLFPTAPPPVDACGEVMMTREERMGALWCMGRAMVMHELARGAGMPGALSYAAAQKAKRQKSTASPPLRAWPPAVAAMMKRDAAARTPPFHPCHPLPFSAQHKAPDVTLSSDRLTVTRPNEQDCTGNAWARSEWGVGAGYGVVRWAVQLGQEGGIYRRYGFTLGVASDAFREYTEAGPEQLWFFEDNCVYADGQQQQARHRFYRNQYPFAAGDVVTFELERAPGVEGVLRMRHGGRPRELRGLPRDGMLYPIVGLCHSTQSVITMVACLELPVNAVNAASASP